MTWNWWRRSLFHEIFQSSINTFSGISWFNISTEVPLFTNKRKFSSWWWYVLKMFVSHVCRMSPGISVILVLQIVFDFSRHSVFFLQLMYVAVRNEYEVQKCNYRVDMEKKRNILVNIFHSIILQISNNLY